MEENYILKSQKKKRLHFTLKLLIGLIVIALICFGFIFMLFAHISYGDFDLDHQDVITYYYCEDDPETFVDCYHTDGYETVENGQYTIHKQKYVKTIREGYWGGDDDYDSNWVAPVIKHKDITTPCNHKIHDYKNRYDYAFASIKCNSAITCSDTEGYVYIREDFNYIYIIAGVAYLLFAIYIIIKHLKNRKYEIIVAAGEVQGRLAFGKKITIPAYNIKSVSKKGKYKVIIETEDKPVKFKYIKNSNEIVEAINNLDKSIPESLVNSGFGSEANIPSVPEELKAYKELFESGIISEQEYLNKIKEFNEKA